MSEPFIAEIRPFGFNWAPRGWALCDGQLLPIAQNQSLFAVIGTIYGGDGRTTFALPDLRGRVPVHRGSGAGLSPVSLGVRDGEESVVLPLEAMPAHTHGINASADAANSNLAESRVLADPGAGKNLYGPEGNTVSMSANSIAGVGGGQAHDNMQPYLSINYCIALQGIFPSRN
jgi:microcystin-dependent protein